MHVWVPGDTTISVSTMDGESTPEMKMETAFVKSMSIPWKGFGLSCEAGCAPIGAFHKRNFRSTSVSSSLCTMPENEGKRCFMRSLSYWSNKTLESNMSHEYLCPTGSLSRGEDPHLQKRLGRRAQTGDRAVCRSQGLDGTPR